MYAVTPLLDYLNTHDKEETYAKIIIAILQNTAFFKQATISEMAAFCFVSPATLSRFSKFFGFDSYSQMRKTMTSSVTSPTLSFRLNRSELDLLHDEPGDFLKFYGQALIDSIQDAVDHLSIPQTEAVLEEIHQHQDVYLFGYNASNSVASEMQTGLIVSGKLVYTGESFEDQLKLTQYLTKDSLVIVLSSFGNFFYNNLPLYEAIRTSGCRTILITQHTLNMMTSSFDQIVYVTEHNHLQVGSYPLQFFCEYLVRRYYDRFGLKE